MSKHTMTALYPAPGADDGGIEVEIRFSFRPARSATTTQPPEDATADVLSVRFPRFGGLLPEGLQTAIEQWADEYLDSDEGMQKAHEAVFADADDYADFKRRQLRDDALTGEL